MVETEEKIHSAKVEQQPEQKESSEEKEKSVQYEDEETCAKVSK